MRSRLNTTTMELAAGVGETGQAPEWIRIFPAGEVRLDFGGQPSRMTDEAWELIQAAVKGREPDMVVDYEHQTLGDGEAPAAGWITQLEWRPGDGLYGRVRWTERAKEYLAGSEYRYISPVWTRRADGTITRLINVALTNQPKMQNVAAVAAKQNLSSEDHMDPKLKKLLGLAEDAGEDQVLAKVEKLVAAKGQLDEQLVTAKADLETAAKTVPQPVLDALELKEGTEQLVVASIKALKSGEGQAGELRQQMAALQDQMADMKAAELVQAAMKKGQLTPAERDNWALEMAKASPEQFAKVVGTRPEGSAVPVDELQVAKGAPKGGACGLPGDISAQLGLSSEDLTKYGPKEAE